MKTHYVRRIVLMLCFIVLFLLVISMFIFMLSHIHSYNSQEVLEQNKNVVAEFMYSHLLKRPQLRRENIERIVDDLVTSNENLFGTSALKTDSVIEMSTFSNSVVVSCYLVITTLFKSRAYGLSYEKLRKFRRLRQTSVILNLISFLLIPLCLFFHILNLDKCAITTCFINFFITFILLFISIVTDSKTYRRYLYSQEYQAALKSNPQKWAEYMCGCLHQAYCDGKLSDGDAFLFFCEELYSSIFQLIHVEKLDAHKETIVALERIGNEILIENILNTTNNYFLERFRSTATYTSNQIDNQRTMYLWGRIICKLKKDKNDDVSEVMKDFFKQELRKYSTTSEGFFPLLRLEAECSSNLSPKSDLYSGWYKRINDLFF